MLLLSMGTYANILLTLILLSILSGLLFLGLIIIKFRRIIVDFRQFVTAVDDKTPSPLATLVAAMSDIAARSIVARIKMTFMGKQSGDVRAQSSVDASIAEDQVNSINPLIGSLLDSFPTLKKSLLKNPALIDFALSKLSRFQGSNELGSNGHNTQTKFKL